MSIKATDATLPMEERDKHKNQSIVTLLEMVRAIATEGLSFAKDEYDRARYKHLLELVCNLVAQELLMAPQELLQMVQQHWGCITPKIGIEISITSVAGSVLVLRRSDDNKWGVPCGWMDIGETPFETARREALEEAGIAIEPIGYMAINTKGPESGLAHQLNILVCTRPVSESVNVSLSHEHRAAKWITATDVLDWHPGHERTVATILRYVANPEQMRMIEAE